MKVSEAFANHTLAELWDRFSDSYKDIYNVRPPVRPQDRERILAWYDAHYHLQNTPFGDMITPNEPFDD